MKRIAKISAGLLIAMAISCCTIQRQSDSTELEPSAPALVPKYTLVWHDEFDGQEVDQMKWSTRQADKLHGAGWIREDCAKLDGEGHLILTARSAPSSSEDSTIETGMIGSQGKFEQRYGYFEARIRFHQHPGHHGAFWLQSPTYGKITDDPGASGAEIDIIEYFGAGRSLSQNLHWNAYGSEDKKQVGQRLELPAAGQGVSGDFHVYALEWTPEYYAFYMDGVETWRTNEALSHRSQYLILSMLCSDWELRNLTEHRLPDAMQVDYVRVFAADPPSKTNR
ncbi:MAG: glycoside hydrolase family 16 protein [Planctomycetota bacterium]